VADGGFGRRSVEAADFSANWQAYVASSAWAHRWMAPLADGFNEVLFPGLLTSGLALLAVVLAVGGRLASGGAATAGTAGAARRPREALLFYALLAVGAAWFSFGPAGGLYSVLGQVLPVLGFLRAPVRVGIVVTLALVMCATLALAHLASGRRRLALSAAAVVLACLELWPGPLPLQQVAPDPAPVYRALARLPPAPVAEFPFFYLRSDFPRHTYYMLQSTAHWRPLVNGYSDHIPQDFRDMVIDLSSFPSRAAFDLLRERRVRYVVFHLNWYDRRSREKLLQRLDTYAAFLGPVLADGDMRLYRIERWP
jgi:hypothetical protein